MLSKLCNGRARSFISISNRSMSSLIVDNPYTGAAAARINFHSMKEMDSIVQKSSIAQMQWASSTLSERIEAVTKAYSHLKNNSDSLAGDITAMMGKPLGQAKGEINTSFDRAMKMNELSTSVLAEEHHPSSLHLVTRKVPVGVVVIIAPWNYPIATATNAIVPAILSGNSIIIKHSERTPLVSEAVAKAFKLAGVPENLVSFVHSEHDVTGALITHEKVGAVSFTGSVATGRKIYASVAAKKFIDVTLELGGKDAAYVASDADPVSAANGVIDGACYNAGQSCCGIERVYVHADVYDKFVEAAHNEMKAYVLGDPTDSKTNMGPMALPTAPAFLDAQIKQAVSKGAKIIIGGKSLPNKAGQKRFFEPTLLVNTDHTMDVVNVESFAPILPIMKVYSDGEAITKMNDSAYGLTAAIYTKSQDRALKMSNKLQAGTIFMNRCDYLDPVLPWTGFKDSGKGCSLSKHGFSLYSKLQNLHFRKA